MLPSLAIDQMPYIVFGNVILVRKFLLSHSTSISLAYLCHLFVSQFCAAITRSTHIFLATFGDHVLRVFKVSPKKQMLWIATGWIVALVEYI